ncbi:MAG TPA: NAD(P)H-hydrate dehydratase [Acidobacteriota bacterium]|nr:NAD(P)H-hydrate dehydratase [Acidobacteriota bacterium]
MKILTARQMAEVDRLTSQSAGIPSLLLMENAAFHLYLALLDYFDRLERTRILIVCGKGNNGGDGLALARQLLQRGVSPEVALLAERNQIRGDAAVNLRILESWPHPILEIPSAEAWDEAAPNLDRLDVIVDAILGTGITQPLRGLYADAVAAINETDAFVLSVDIPSGMPADSVKSPPLAIRADATVTFTAPKVAHALNSSQECIGDLYVAPIGTPPSLLDREEFFLHLLTPEDIRRETFIRPVSSHKGFYGDVALIAGSLGKSGAAALCGSAALRSGSGLVTVLTPRSVQLTVASAQPELMTEGLGETETGSLSDSAAALALEKLQGRDAAGLGPGLSLHPETVRLAHNLVAESPAPLVIDADGLNAFEGNLDRLSNRHGLPLILTPHPGEFSRLTAKPVADLLEDQVELTRSFAVRRHLWIVLKTFRPLIAAPDGRLFVSAVGNPGMATAGMGDVLTGVLTSMVGRARAAGLNDVDDVTQAVCAAVFLHAIAGDVAAESVGQESLTAGDVIDCLPEAWDILLETDETPL